MKATLAVFFHCDCSDEREMYSYARSRNRPSTDELDINENDPQCAERDETIANDFSDKFVVPECLEELFIEKVIINMSLRYTCFPYFRLSKI